MGGRFSSRCAATYVFVLRPPTDEVSTSGDQRSESSRHVRTNGGDSTSGRHFDPDEAMDSLHQCLRDIDVFVHQVQVALEMSQSSKSSKKKLAFKRRQRRSGSSSSHGGTSRTSEMNCYMPTELDMSGILKRVKLAINYVARLKYHLYQPNAPELVHVIFAHLATLVSVCRTCPLYKPSLPSRVVLPLLSRDAVRFLRLSLVSTETDLWKSLGRAWTTPRDEWKGEDSLCNAMLLEGWEACYPPNRTVVHQRPFSRNRHRSGTTDTETFLSEDTRSLSTPKSRLS